MKSGVMSLRPAVDLDFDFCSRLYFEGMARVIRELNLDMAKQVASFREQWNVGEVQVIVCDGTDAGWLQSRMQDGALFLAQIYMDAAFQNQGIGTGILGRLFEEAGSTGHDVTLAVVKSNPAVRLYERLGFRTTHEDERKYYMRRSIRR